MEQKAKKLRPNETEFMDMNDDCIRHILWKLHPTDLCSMSFTCERMQRLAFDHFTHQYPSKKVTIAMDQANGPYIRNSDGYIKYFAKCIRNIRIDSPGANVNMKRLFEFIKAECCADLRILELTIAGRLQAKMIAVITEQLENLSTLHLDNPFSRYDIYEVLLRHCKKLQHLIIRSSSTFVSTWMRHSYPTLTRLTIDVSLETQIQEIVMHAKRFFQLNPQIKDFICTKVDIVKSVLANATKIEELTIRFTDCSQLQALFDTFKKPSQRNDIQTFKLSIGPQRMTSVDCNTLQNMNACRPIHSLSCFFMGLTNEGTFMTQFTFLEELYLHIPTDYSKEEEMLTILSENLSNLKDLRFNLNGRDRMFKDVAMKFVTNSIKLKFLNFVMCHINTFVFHANDLVALNERRALRCGMPIRIRMDYDNYENYEKPTFTQPAKAVMNITFASMWRDDE